MPSCRRVLSCLSTPCCHFFPPTTRPLLKFNHRQSLNSNRIDCNTTPSVISTSLAPVNHLSPENCDRFHPIPPTMQPFLPQFGTESPRTSCNNFFYSFHFRLRRETPLNVSVPFLSSNSTFSLFRASSSPTICRESFTRLRLPWGAPPEHVSSETSPSFTRDTMADSFQCRARLHRIPDPQDQASGAPKTWDGL
jgi:hypothetical protein